MIALLAMPACLGMAAIAPAVVPMLYGEEFRPAVPAAMIIAALSTVSVSTVIATHLVQALERSDFIFYTAILGAGLSIVGGFLLVPEFGLIGAAVSRSVVQVIMVAIGLWFVVARLATPSHQIAPVDLCCFCLQCACGRGRLSLFWMRRFRLLPRSPWQVWCT